MSILQTIEHDYIDAAKAKQAEKVSTLRMLRAALKNTQIEKMHPLSEDETMDVLRKELKKLKDARETFVQGKRDDLVAKSDQEILILTSYLPTALSDDELRALVQEVITSVPGATAKEFGRIMGEVVKRSKGRADGGRVSVIVKENLE